VRRTTWRCWASASCQQQQVTHAQAQAVRLVIAQEGARGAARQAAGLVAPGVEAQVVVRAVELQGRQQFEGLGAGRDQRLRAVGRAEPRGRAVCARQQQRAVQPGRAVAGGEHPAVGRGSDLEGHPGARVAALVHRIVQKTRMPAHRHALARRAQVGLGRDCVLEVGDLVGAEGQCLGQRDHQVGRAAFLPVRHQHRQPVQHQSAEALVVARQVVDVGCALRQRRAVVLHAAVEVAGAVDLEAEGDLRQRRVDAVGRRVGAGRGHQPQLVAREVADAIELHRQHVAAGRHADGLRVAHAHTAADLDVGRGQRRGRREGQRVHEMQQQPRLAMHHLQVFDAVESPRRIGLRGLPHGGDASRVAAEVLAVHVISRLNCAWPVCCVSSTV
jgi:hypothetical protein